MPAEECIALGANQRRLEPYPNRALSLGSLTISRALPLKDRRLVGPWCFLDRFGPLTFHEGKPMDVAPHPHIGLQTVTWLQEGEIVHHDSLGFESLLRPGGVNVMTSGDGIAHAEQTPRNNSGRLSGVQLWTALPDAARHSAAHFVQIEEVPVVESASGIVQVFAGTLDGATSPAPHYSDLLGADLRIHPRQMLVVPLNAAHEHAVLVMNGDCALDAQSLEERVLYLPGNDSDRSRLLESEWGDGDYSSVDCHFQRRSSCGGTSWRELLRRFRRRVRTGKRSVGLGRSQPTMARA